MFILTIENLADQLYYKGIAAAIVNRVNHVSTLKKQLKDAIDLYKEA